MTGALGLYSLGEGLSGLGVTFGGCIIVLILIWLICFLFSHPKLLGTLVLIGVGWGVYEVVNMVKEDNHKKKYSSEQIVTNNSFKFQILVFLLLIIRLKISIYMIGVIKKL